MRSAEVGKRPSSENVKSRLGAGGECSAEALPFPHPEAHVLPPACHHPEALRGQELAPHCQLTLGVLRARPGGRQSAGRLSVPDPKSRCGGIWRPLYETSLHR